MVFGKPVRWSPEMFTQSLLGTSDSTTAQPNHSPSWHIPVRQMQHPFNVSCRSDSTTVVISGSQQSEPPTCHYVWLFHSKQKKSQAGEEQYHCKQTSRHQKIQSSTWPIRLQVTLPSTSRKASTVPVNFRSLISQVITDKQVKHVWQALQKKLFLCLLDAFQDRPQVLQLLITSFTRWHSAIGLIKRTKFQLPIAWKDIQLLPKKKI